MLGKVTTGLAESNGSLLPGLRVIIIIIIIKSERHDNVIV